MMKIFKFCWHDENGLPVFKEFEAPDNETVLRERDCSFEKVPNNFSRDNDFNTPESTSL